MTRSRARGAKKFVVFLAMAAACVGAAAEPSAAQTYSVIKTFVPAPEGQSPQAALIQGRDGNLYGTTASAGPFGNGTIFRIDTAGALTVIHGFNSSDGSGPNALIQAADGSFYGTTSSGGASGWGTIFKLDANGAFETLHNFAGTDGAAPSAALLQASDGNFYGTTGNGGSGFGSGSDSYGTIFKLGGDGTGFTTLYNFAFTDGAFPTAALIEGMDGRFYGTTRNGGSFRNGTVFKFDASSRTLQTLHAFVYSTDGAYPSAAVVQSSDGSLYGTAGSGGTWGWGTVFKLGASGTTFQTLHSFTGSDGANPYGGVIKATDGNLYGTTKDGGTLGFGTIFKIDGTGNGFQTLHNFAQTDGAYPYAGLVQASDGTFYGTTLNNRTRADGTVFTVDAGGVFHTLHDFEGTDGANPYASLIEPANGTFYGTTLQGGASNAGTVYKVSDTGSTFTIVHDFASPDGTYPIAPLLHATDGSFYGTTYQGGTPGNGTIFKIDPAGNFQTIHNFNGTDGANPYAALIQASDGNFYGTTPYGGVNGYGTIFRLDASGAFKTLHSFSWSDGGYPFAALIEGSDGSFYGTTNQGGTSGAGTVFKLEPSEAFQTLHNFDWTDGAYPYAPLIRARDGNFYGTTYQGGGPGYGTVFKLDASGTFQSLHSFSWGDGAYPFVGLIQASEGSLYGAAFQGGTYGYGTLFTIDTTGTTFTTLHEFAADDGRYPLGTLLQASDGSIYGTTQSGGAGAGVVFRLKLSKKSTSLSLAPATGTYGGSVTLGATLTSAQPSDRTIQFTLEGQLVGEASTNAAGVASVNVSPSLRDPGIYAGAIGASFAGDAQYAPSSATADLRVLKTQPTVTVTGGTYRYDGKVHDAIASATGVLGEALPVTVTYAGGATPLNPGTYDATATFIGNVDYEPASATAQLTIVESTPPVVQIASPLNGAVYALQQQVKASYTCTDASLAACASDVPAGTLLNTSTPGVFTLTVTGRDAYGNETTSSATYTVRAAAERGWQRAADLPTATYFARAVTLNDGRVLILGGSNGQSPIATTSAYSPKDNLWYALPDLTDPRGDNPIVKLDDGRVLVSGGSGVAGLLSSAEIFDPVTNTWTLVAPMNLPRARHTLTRLADGRVLATGGYYPATEYDAYQRTAEIYDPVANTWTRVGDMAERRVGHSASLLPDGRVLVVGGADWAEYKQTVEIFDPKGNTFAYGPSLPDDRRYYHAAVTLPDGGVLVAGGMNFFTRFASAWIYRPEMNQWIGAGAMSQSRVYLSMERMSDGRVLAVGGYTGSVASAAADIFDPSSRTWTTVGPASIARYLAAAAPLQDGGVLFAGGYSSGALNAVEIWNGARLIPALQIDPASSSGAPIDVRVTGAVRPVNLVVGNNSYGPLQPDAQGVALFHGVSVTGFSYGPHPQGLVATSDADDVTAAARAYGSLVITDGTAPVVTITSPTAGSTITAGASLVAAYGCEDPESGIASCIGTVPSGASIDTKLPGSRTFTVAATNTVGLAASTTVTYTVAKATSTTSIAVSATHVTFGSIARLTATIGGVPSIAPTGTVTFIDGDATLGTANVSTGVATLLISSLSAGTHTLKALYSGDVSYTGSGSASVTLTVTVTAGQLRTSGVNETGQLGVGNTVASTSLQRVNGLSDVIALAAGAVHGLALRSNGTVWAWGSNWAGQLGTGNTTTSLAPIQVPGLQGIVAIGAGEAFSVALRNDGKILTWGFNGSGELGNGGATLDYRATPQVVGVLPGVVAIANGSNRVLALTADGRVFGWGLNSRGELGTLNVFKAYTPIQLNISDVVAIASGAEHVAFVKSDGTVWTAGGGEWGQLGNGTWGATSVPVQVSNLTNVIAVSAGAKHTIALKSDGTVWAWGDGSYGKLGNGTLEGVSVPIPVSNLTEITTITSTRYRSDGSHNVAIRSDGTLWAWGPNFYGQFGTGTTAQSVSTPVQIPVKGAVAVAAGERFTLSAGASAEATTLQLAAADVPYGSALTLVATLRAAGSPVAGALIAFDVNNDGVLNDGTAVTDANGNATLTVSSATATALGVSSVASYSSTARFAGDASYESSIGTATFAITDPTPPTVEPIVTGTLGQNGWYVSDVTVTWSVTDPESTGTPGSSCVTTTVQRDTPGLTLTCTATSAGGSATASIVIKRDTAPPAITMTTPPTGSNATYAFGQRVIADYACIDSVSGAVACAAPVLSGNPIDTATAGQKTFAVTAIDMAGNTRTSTATFVVSKGTPKLSVRSAVAATLTVGSGPYGVAVNPRTQYVYVTNRGNGTVSVVDGNPSRPAFNTVVATISGLFSPRGVAVDSTTNRVYVANSGNGGSVSVIDGDPASASFHSIVGFVFVGGWASHGIVADQTTSNIYVGNEVAYAWTAIDGQHLTAQNMGQGSACGPYDLALNAKTGRLYITNSWCGNSLVIDVNPGSPTFHQRLAEIAAGGLAAIDVNPATNEVYISNPYDSQTIRVVDGNSNQVTGLMNVGGNVFELAADPDAGIVYATVPGERQLAVIDADPTSATYRAVIGTLPTGGGAAGVAVDHESGQIYVANSDDGTVTVFALPAIMYGTPLDAEHIGASSSLAGSFSYVPALGTLLDAGVHPVLATFAPEDASNYDGASIDSLVAVRRAPPVITLTGGSFAYDGQPHPARAMVHGVNGEDLGELTLTYNGTAQVPVNAGTYAVVASFAGNRNYEAATATATLVIDKAQPIVTWKELYNPTYGIPLGPDQLKAAANIAGTFGYEPAAGTILDAGDHTLTATFTPVDATNYESAAVTATLTVFKARPGINVTGGTFTYDDLPHEVTVSIVGALGETLTNDTLVTYSSPTGGAGVPTAVGSYWGQAQFGGNINYESASGSAEIIINPAPLGVIARDASRIYGGSNPVFDVVYDSFVSGETASALGGTLQLTTDATPTSGVGTYPIVPSGVTASNYAITFVNGTLTITPAALSVSANDATRVYGDANPPFTGVVTGVKNGDVIDGAYTTSATAVSPVGTYAIVPSLRGTALSNYATPAVTNGTLTITPASIAVAANNAIRVYGETNPVFTGVITGVKNGDAIVASYATTAGPTTPVGSYAIVPSLSGAALSNYAPPIVTAGTLTIQQASTAVSVTASANPASFGQAVTYTASIAAVAPGSGTPTGSVQFFDGTTSLGTVALVNGAATLTTSLLPGTHTVTSQYSGDLNFVSSAGAITETVNSAASSTTTTLTASPNPAAVGTPITLTAVVAPVVGNATVTGLVKFYDGASVEVGAAILSVVRGKAQASVTLNLNWPAGQQTFVAVYAGDSIFSGSTSLPATVTVYQGTAPAPTSTTVSAPLFVAAGQPFAATVTVSSGKGKPTAPAGTVVLYVDGINIGAATVDATGSAKFTVAGVAPGTHSLVGQYLGDPNGAYAGSTSSAAITFAQ